MSGAAAVSAAKNRRSRESVVKDSKQFQPQQSQSQQQQQQRNQPQQELVELTPLQALHQHDYRLRRSEEVLKQLISTTEELKNSAMTSSVSSTDSKELQETVDLFNERIISIEKYIDEELAQSLNLKEKEDKDGEDAIYTKMNSLESLLKELKTELVRIQGSSRDTSMSFLKYKSETDTQIKELKETIKNLSESVVAVNTIAAKAQALSETHAQIFLEALQPSTLTNDKNVDDEELSDIGESTVNGC